MGKRKSEIFTVAELVVNWFEANNHSMIPSRSNVGIVNRFETVWDGLVQPNAAEVAVEALGVTSWPKAVEKIEPPAEVAVLVSITVGRGTEVPSTADMDESEGPARQAFWALLQATGYK